MFSLSTDTVAVVVLAASDAEVKDSTKLSRKMAVMNTVITLLAFILSLLCFCIYQAITQVYNYNIPSIMTLLVFFINLSKYSGHPYIRYTLNKFETLLDRFRVHF